jgi:succinate dehydrogenase/fumarate reductase flavoprotein subunit
MDSHVGVVRDQPGLTGVLADLADLREALTQAQVGDRGVRWNAALRRMFEMENQVMLGQIVAASALQRTESRGAHFRRDHPEHAENAEHTEVSREGEHLAVQRRTVAA